MPFSAGDFDEVKTAFLRAQQIKAGLDAGFIRENDYQNVKKAFLDSLNMSSNPAAVASEQASLFLTVSDLQCSSFPPCLGPAGVLVPHKPVQREKIILHTQDFERRCAPGDDYQRLAAAHLTACYASHLSEASSTSCPQTAGHERQPGNPASSCSKQHHAAELRPAGTADKSHPSQRNAVQRPLPSDQDNSPNKHPKNGGSTPQADWFSEFLRCCVLSCHVYDRQDSQSL